MEINKMDKRDKKILTPEERKNPCFVMKVIMETIKKYGGATLDCGHQTTKEVILEQQEDGQFIALCAECGGKK